METKKLVDVAVNDVLFVCMVAKKKGIGFDEARDYLKSENGKVLVDKYPLWEIEVKKHHMSFASSESFLRQVENTALQLSSLEE